MRAQHLAFGNAFAQHQRPRQGHVEDDEAEVGVLLGGDVHLRADKVGAQHAHRVRGVNNLFCFGKK